MDEESKISAGLLTGYQFFPHPDNPTMGVLRLDTKIGFQWVSVTRKGLLSLAEACVKHADELAEVQ
jgi:hypothetical protein